MKTENKELLEDVIEDRLTRALEADSESDEGKALFKEAMDAVSKQIELDKIETSYEEQIKKAEMDNERSIRELKEKARIEDARSYREEKFKAEEGRKDRLVQCGIFAAGLVVGPIVEHISKRSLAKMLCLFEKEYSFTTTAGRSLSGLFRFRK